MSKLVIVESPAKAKTIKKYLGGDYEVIASMGHVRDLPKARLCVDVKNDFKPKYAIIKGKEKLVSELKEAAEEADTVYLATDPDREGEAISWHLAYILGLDEDYHNRVTFNEITKTGITEGMAHPRSIDQNLVNAQQARRILDRLVGYSLSPFLAKTIRRGLSAGRVQSVALRIIVDREEEIRKFKPEEYWSIDARLTAEGSRSIFGASFYGDKNGEIKITNKEQSDKILADLESAAFMVESVKKGKKNKQPAPPFITSTLQQEASRKLGFQAKRTMKAAQELYEGVDIEGMGAVGLITYMRTDSVNLSDLALGTAKEAIFETYGEKYYKFRQYHTKSKGAQEAHEAIRPTYISNVEAGSSSQEKKLYELIRKRTIACQMADAELERTTISVGISGQTERFVAVGEVISFEGFLQVYMESNDDDTEKEQENGLLPPVKLHETLSLKDIVATERFTQRPPRYTEASLVRRLEELGIGRPSTYAPTIQTIQNREYVVKGDKEGVERAYTVVSLSKGKIEEAEKTETVGADRNKLMPTDIGTVVNDFLMEYFPDVLDYNFTASVEKEFDSVAEGELVWTKAIDKFYKIFHPIVEATAAVKTEHKVGERELGIDPKSGNPVFVKIGRYGPVVQIGAAHADDKEAPKPQFASLMKGQSIDTITLEEALKLFDLPRTVGEYEGKVMVAAVGRFGPFIRHDGKFVSIPKDLNPLTITAEEAIALIEGKRVKDEQRFIKKFEEDPDCLLYTSPSPRD